MIFLISCHSFQGKNQQVGLGTLVYGFFEPLLLISRQTSVGRREKIDTYMILFIICYLFQGRNQ